ncbi:MAG: UvrD-helicase domain-containing protein [Planctomycetes bacterium]|nr:UvrD-helicase domain-containing protein [Planctomycetota bacterium]
MPPSPEELLAGLNPEQRRAAETLEGPLLVLAGAGTGKTRVITYRIAHMLARFIEPESVLAVTFTNKAATEMKERIAALVGKADAERLSVGTFHAFCVRRLRQHADKLGFSKGFSICDASDQQSAVKAAMRELRIPEKTLHPGLVQSRISLAKNQLLSQSELLERSGGDEELVCAVWERYDAALRRQRMLDFDDLLLQTLKLLQEHPRALRSFRERWQYVLVDEYQDTNGPQYEIVRLICQEHRNLCVVGDDDQSIYSWRGADVRKILGFAKDFPGAEVVRLETNYRSTKDILEAANRVIAHNIGRHPKELRAHAGPGQPVCTFEARDEEDEADFIASEIGFLVRRGDAAWRDVAILVRTQVQPRAFEARLRAAGVPYRLVGGMSFFDRKEIRDLLAYLKLVANPDDESSLLRILNCPPRGVGKTSVERVLAWATERGLSANHAFARAEEIEKVPAAAKKAVVELLETLAELGRRRGGKRLVETLKEMVGRVGYQQEVERCYPDPQTRQVRWAAVEELYNFAENYARRSGKPSLAGFLEELALNAADQQDDDGQDQDAVALMTLHAAKGLEFPRVYLVGLEEGILPHSRAVAEGGVDEERRLMYVGVTRAREHLTVSYAAERARFGRRSATTPSRFWYELLGEAPPEGWTPIEDQRAAAVR